MLHLPAFEGPGRPKSLSFPALGLSLAHTIQACQTHPCALLRCSTSLVQDRVWVTQCFVVAKIPKVEGELGKSLKIEDLSLSLG